MIIIPAIDLKNGKVVRLYKGDFNKVSEYSNDPVSVALSWQGLGASLIHIVDLEGALTGEPQNKAIIKKIIKSLKIETEVSGGFRTKELIEEFIQAGATRIILGSKVQEDLSFLEDISKVYSKRLAISLDAKYLKEDKSGLVLNLSIKGWLEDKEVPLEALLKEIYSLGIRFINYTDVSRDGTLEGIDLNSVTKIIEIVNKFTPLEKTTSTILQSGRNPLRPKVVKNKRQQIPLEIEKSLTGFKGFNLIVSGGVSSIEDIKKIARFKDFYGLIIGKALYEGRVDFKEANKIALGK
ncbi:MAG: HisA/HisF-related TIM barrel protein [Candidatus Omnitrophota bacterium]